MPRAPYNESLMKQMDRRLLILMRLRQEKPVRAADLAERCE